MLTSTVEIPTLYVCMCAYMYVYVHVCVCVSIRLELSTGKVLFISEFQVHSTVPGTW